ncbi:MAG: DNA repair protein RadA [Bacteroidales bacterium]|jgi:hypothetical protein|nr:DNA repair protein RadA [Bacteroidales bacterium]
MSRALSVTNILNYKPNCLPFTGKWLKSFGEPELTGCWLVWGESGNGKTRFVLQLCKYLASMCKVAYNSLEEGLSQSLKTAIIDTGMMDVKRNFLLLDKEPITELIARLEKRKSPDVIVIDSWQYTGLKYTDYTQLREMFPKKLFIIISHADGKQPAGRVAKSIRYDAFVKIRIEGYRANALSRYGGGEPYTIWEEGAAKYWGEQEVLT